MQAQLQHDSTLRTLLSVYLPQHKLVSQAIKAQFNEGRSLWARSQSPCCSAGHEGWRREWDRVELWQLLLQAGGRASPCTLTATSRWTAAASAPLCTSTQVREFEVTSAAWRACGPDSSRDSSQLMYGAHLL